jgi:hypothetical protein
MIYYIRLESRLALRKSTSKVKAAIAQVDANVVSVAVNARAQEQVLASRPVESAQAARKRRAEFSWRESPEPDRTVVIFPAEYKRALPTTNVHQLVYDLATAMSHRYAIGIPDEVIYGATGVGGRLTVLAARWDPGQHSVPVSLHTCAQCFSHHYHRPLR